MRTEFHFIDNNIVDILKKEFELCGVDPILCCRGGSNTILIHSDRRIKTKLKKSQFFKIIEIENENYVSFVFSYIETITNCWVYRVSIDYIKIRNFKIYKIIKS